MRALTKQTVLIWTILVTLLIAEGCSSDNYREPADDTERSTADDETKIDDGDISTSNQDVSTNREDDTELLTDSSEADGGTELPFDEFAYKSPPRCDNVSCNTDDCRQLVDVCWITSQGTHFVGIVEVLDISDLQQQDYCGEDLYASNYVKARLRVRQSVYQEDGGMSDTVDAVFLTQGMRSFHFGPGDLLLIGMRPALGTWFGLGYLYVEDGASNQTEDSCLYRISLPEALDDLVRESKNARSDYENECPDYAPYTMSDERFSAWTHAPPCQ